MRNILGLGSPGRRIAEQLKGYKEYCVYSISTCGLQSSSNDFILPILDHPEEYENLSINKINKFLSKIKENLVLVVCGASYSSGIALKILEPLVKRGVSVEVVYVMPERGILGETKALQENLVRNVLQEYTRSGIFKKITLISNLCLERFAEQATVFDYFEKINEVLTSSYYMLDVFKNSTPVSSTFSKTKQANRINTIGLTTLDSDEEKMFFPFEDASEIVYYFGINEEKLKTEKNLFRKITDRVKSRINEKVKVSFGIYPTQYEDDYIYVEYFSPTIQKSD